MISPILVLGAILPTLAQPVDRNSINRGKAYSGKKTAGFDYSLDLDKMKAFCKKNQCTINDYTSSVLSCALQAYFVSEEQRIKDAGETLTAPPESVHVAVPFSFRQPIAKIQEVKMNNDFGSLLIDMKLF